MNQPTEHSGLVSRGRVCGCGCWHCWQVTGDRWDIVCSPSLPICFGFFWYLCFYPHTLRDSVSPVCGIFPYYRVQDHGSGNCAGDWCFSDAKCLYLMIDGNPQKCSNIRGNRKTQWICVEDLLSVSSEINHSREESLCILFAFITTHFPLIGPSPIQSISRHVPLSVCVYITPQKQRFPMD